MECIILQTGELIDTGLRITPYEGHIVYGAIIVILVALIYWMNEQRKQERDKKADWQEKYIEKLKRGTNVIERTTSTYNEFQELKNEIAELRKEFRDHSGTRR